jgi:ankyrin repeat protein
MKLSNYAKMVGSGSVILAGFHVIRDCQFMSPWSPIEKAVTFGDAQSLDRILKSNPSLANKRFRPGGTQLNLAARCQYPTETTDLLLKYGVDMNAEGWPFAATPLQSAAWAGKTGAGKALLAHKPDVKAIPADDGSTALNYALSSNGLRRNQT